MSGKLRSYLSPLSLAIIIIKSHFITGANDLRLTRPKTPYINQSINHMFCPRADLSLQTQHFPHYPLLSLLFRIFIQSTYHNVVCHLISSSAANFLPFQSILQQAVPSQLVAQNMSFPLLYQFQNYSSLSHSFQHHCIFNFSVHFTRSILLHIHISNASSRFCSFRRSVQVSVLYNAILHKALHQFLLKIPGPVMLEGKDSINHATAKDNPIYSILISNLKFIKCVYFSRRCKT